MMLNEVEGVDYGDLMGESVKQRETTKKTNLIRRILSKTPWVDKYKIEETVVTKKKNGLSEKEVNNLLTMSNAEAKIKERQRKRNQ